MSRITIQIIAPGVSGKPFSVTLRSECGGFDQTVQVGADEKAAFSVPEGQYMLCVRGGPSRDPGGQCKWITVREGCDAAYSAAFQECRRVPTAAVTLLLRDANYPNMIPLNGGVTVWRISRKL